MKNKRGWRQEKIMNLIFTFIEVRRLYCPLLALDKMFLYIPL